MKFSFYLDLAACIVLSYHINDRLIIQNLLPLSSYAHPVVIIFFIFLGYVIAYIIETKENTLKKYVSARIARIYSVALPIALPAPLLDMVGRELYHEIYSGYFSTSILGGVIGGALAAPVGFF